MDNPKNIRRAKITLRVVGIMAILCAGLGLLYNAVSLAFSGGLRGYLAQHPVPDFYPAFYGMSAICVVCYALLAGFGVALCRGRLDAVRGFAILLVFEVVYAVLVLGFWWLLPFRRSIYAAFGVANGGLTIQAYLLFPFWALPAAFWARRQLRAAPYSIAPMQRSAWLGPQGPEV